MTVLNKRCDASARFGQHGNAGFKVSLGGHRTVTGNHLRLRTGLVHDGLHGSDIAIHRTAIIKVDLRKPARKEQVTGVDDVGFHKMDPDIARRVGIPLVRQTDRLTIQRQGFTP